MNKKILTVVLLVLVLVFALALTACTKKDNKDTYAITIDSVTGAGTSDSPFAVSVERGKQVELTLTPSDTAAAITVEAVKIKDTDKTSAITVAQDGTKVTITANALGKAGIKLTAAGHTNVFYVYVTVTDKLATGMTLSELTASGTAGLYTADIRQGASLSAPYTVTPADADNKVVSWKIGTMTGSTFTEDTTRGITASSATAGVAKFTAAKTATVGETYVQATTGSATLYVKLNVVDYSLKTSWDKASFKSDWDTTNATIAENENYFDLDSSTTLSSVSNKLKITADNAYLVINATMGGNEATNAKLYVKVGNDYVKPMVNTGANTFELYPALSSKQFALLYDLSAYVGSTVTVTVGNEAASNHLVLISAELVAVATASEMTTWTKNDIVDDWNWEKTTLYRAGTGEGFDINTYDDKAIGYIYNKLSITNDASRLYIKVRRFDNQDQGRVANCTLFVNGTPIAPLGLDRVVEVQDIDKLTTHLVYDMRAYVGQTVTVAFAQTTPLCGHLVVQEIKLDKYETTGGDGVKSTLTSWDKQQIIDDWVITYAPEYRPDPSEGFVLNTFDNDAIELIYNTLPITADKYLLNVNARKFGHGNDKDSNLLVYVNGNLMTAEGYEKGQSIIPNIDRNVMQHVYDLSEYIGTDAQVVIIQRIPYCGNCVITNIKLTNWDKTVSALTAWNDRETIANDWSIEYAAQYRAGVTEGFDLNTNDDDGNEFIYNYVAITENTSIFTINLRRFGHDEGRVNACIVSVNGKQLIANGKTAAAVPIADTGDTTTLVYDLSEYVGQTVRITILQPIPKTGHLVIMNAALSAPVVA